MKREQQSQTLERDRHLQMSLNQSVVKCEYVFLFESTFAVDFQMMMMMTEVWDDLPVKA